jgi:hypothetical protein
VKWIKRVNKEWQEEATKVNKGGRGVKKGGRGVNEGGVKGCGHPESTGGGLGRRRQPMGVQGGEGVEVGRLVAGRVGVLLY